jgi:hypothetical protein
MMNTISPPSGYPGGYTWDRVVRDRAQSGDGSGRVAIERFYKYNWQVLLAGKVVVFGTTGAGSVVTGETFETTYDDSDTVGK